ncbi:MAG: hypothetical protein ACW98X_21330 [Promethearchaeota archaeon]|jgi:hypothetical protein
MEYGVVINHDIQNIDQNKQYTYDMFSEYFNNPLMYKLKDIEDSFSMYVCKNYCLLSKYCRYIIVVVKKDNYNLNKILNLKDLYWINLQTRTIEDGPSLPTTHNYIPTIKTSLACNIVRYQKSNKKSMYLCEKLNLNIELLNTEDDEFEYSNKGTIVNAIETFQTIITFKS